MASFIEDPGDQFFNGLDMNKLNVDEAYVVLSSDKQVFLHTLNRDCYGVSSTKIVK